MDLPVVGTPSALCNSRDRSSGSRGDQLFTYNGTSSRVHPLRTKVPSLLTWVFCQFGSSTLERDLSARDGYDIGPFWVVPSLRKSRTLSVLRIHVCRWYLARPWSGHPHQMRADVGRTPCPQAEQTSRSGEPAGFLEAVFPDDRQPKDRDATGQNQPMAERQGMPVYGCRG